MKNLISKFAAITTLSLVATFSQAALIETSVDIVHDYGTAIGKYSPNSLNSSNTCDTLNANSVNITDNSNGCGRFFDYFDFSAIDFVSIDSFELSLSFTDVNNNGIFWFLGFIPLSDNEDWNVRPGASASTGSGYDEAHDRNIASVITFNASNVGSTVFANMLANERFSLMFAEESAKGTTGSDNFNLNSATLKVIGQVAEVPAPASLALLGLGLFGLGLVKRRNK